ncbi:MAG: PP2C family protein-serine/threonine phosphatase [Candidatus Hinthialibacter sp.]
MISFALLLAVIIMISGAITRPIRSLAQTTAEIAKGNLDVNLPLVRSNDEVGELSHAFDDMRVALKEYIQDLTETTAAKERIESELKIAHNIQMNFLPKKFPPFPEHEEFEIYAALAPAKEVGGDLYDFFLLDDERLFFVIGDVTDKGVPAALFMAVSKTLIKGIAEHGRDKGMSPSDILMRVNNELALDNETSMFVTVIAGELHLRTGRLRYSNAAHNRPVYIRPGQKPDWLELPGGFLLGIMMDVQYETFETVMRPGDRLLLYTDGVDEAINANDEFYTKPRILQTVANSPSTSAEELVNDVMASVKSFALGAPQSDDITLLALKYNGPSS